MSQLLLKVKADALRSMELIPASLEIYDDKIIFRDRGLLSRKESTISYKQISQVSLNKGLVHSTLEVINTGGFKNIRLEHINNDLAISAKALIEQSIQQAHATGEARKDLIPGVLERMEQLKELLDRKLIDKKEYEEKKKVILGGV